MPILFIFLHLFMRNNKYNIGDYSNELTLIYRIEEKSKHKRGLFLCTCGKIEECLINDVFRADKWRNKKYCSDCSYLVNNKSSSVYESEMKKEKSNDVKQRQIEFNLTVDEYSELITGDCFYCDLPPSQKWRCRQGRRQGLKRQGIDRLDSNLGYSKANCVSCCMNCNWAKRAMSFDEFDNWLKRIFNHMNKLAS